MLSLHLIIMLPRPLMSGIGDVQLKLAGVGVQDDRLDRASDDDQATGCHEEQTLVGVQGKHRLGHIHLPEQESREIQPKQDFMSISSQTLLLHQYFEC